MKLSIKMRKAIPPSQFGLPKLRAFPMPDANHARLAKSGASRALNVGNITPDQKSQIDAKADMTLGQAAKKVRKTAYGEVIGRKRT